MLRALVSCRDRLHRACNSVRFPTIVEGFVHPRDILGLTRSLANPADGTDMVATLVEKPDFVAQAIGYQNASVFQQQNAADVFEKLRRSSPRFALAEAVASRRFATGRRSARRESV